MSNKDKAAKAGTAKQEQKSEQKPPEITPAMDEALRQAEQKLPRNWRD